MFRTLMISVLLVLSVAAKASQQSDILGNCLADNTSGKERKELARWIFMALSAHPEINQMVLLTDEDKAKANKSMADLVTKLLTERCLNETKAAMKVDGNIALQSAFELLGKVAMQEIMTNKDVATAISEYAKYLDSKKLNTALSP